MGRWSTRGCAAGIAAAAAIAVAAPSAAEAAFPGANGKIVIGAGAAGGDIFTVNPDGSGVDNLTDSNNGQVTNEVPAVTPDGKTIYFLRFSPPSNRGFWRMNVDGTGQQQVTGAGDKFFSPTVSPRGDLITVAIEPTSPPIRTDVWVMNADGSNLRRLLPSTPNNNEVPLDWRALPADVDPTGFGELLFYRTTDSPSTTTLWQFSRPVNPATGVVQDRQVQLTPPVTNQHDTVAEYSPDGSQVVFSRGSTTAGQPGVWTMGSSGGGATRITDGQFDSPAWAPDGTRIVTRGGGTSTSVTTMSPQGTDRHTFQIPDSPNPGNLAWQPRKRLSLTLSGGDDVSASETFTVKLELEAGDDPVSNIRLADPAGVGIGNGGFPEGERGEVSLLSGPQPPIPDALAAGEVSTHTLQLRAEIEGRAAVYAKASATGPGGSTQTDGHTLIVDTIPVQAETDADWARYGALGVADHLWVESFRVFDEDLTRRAAIIQTKLAKRLGSQDQKLYFGDKKKLEITPLERLIADRRNWPPKFVAMVTPNKSVRSGDERFTAEELDQVYEEAFIEEASRGLTEHIEGYKKLGRAAKKLVTDTGAELAMSWRTMWGSATTEERAQIEAQFISFLEEYDATFNERLPNLMHTTLRETFSTSTYRYAGEAIAKSIGDATLLSDEMQGLLAQQRLKELRILKLADSDPVAFQRAMAEVNAEYYTFGMSTALDQIIGGGVVRIPAASRAVVSGAGAGLMRFGRAAGVLKENGSVIGGVPHAIELAPAGGPRGLSAAEQLALRSSNFLENVEGATVIRSATGDIFELPNVGGVPFSDIRVKQGILGQLEAEGAAAGLPVELAEVAKPGSALRKLGGVAKTEVTKSKTGKPSMVDGGMPLPALGEANVWTADRPGGLAFRLMSKVRQQAALKEWDAAKQAWAEYNNPVPGSPLAQFKNAVGSRTTIPLGGGAGGLEREAVCQFEEVLVRGQNGAKARLFRVQYYEVREVIDGNIVNSRVIHNYRKGVPQTPDADAVGLGKIIDGEVAPLTRAEKEFYMPRYRRLNTNAARAGNFAGAEHGTTLVMDDAGTNSSGYLLGKFGLGFMSEEVAAPFARRIAPFTGLSPEKLLSLTKGEFGQKAILIRSSVDAYYGEIPFASW